jgi:hypothetical protein
MAVMSVGPVSDFLDVAGWDTHTLEACATAEPWVCLRLPDGASHEQILVSCRIHHVDLIGCDANHWD